MIRHAHKGDLPDILNSYEELFLHERFHGSFSGWRKGFFPKPQLFEDALQEERLYVLRGDKDKFLASMVLGNKVMRGISEPVWRFPANDNEVLSIEALCVPPEEQGRDVGTRMMNYVLKVASSRTIPVIRLAVYERNEPMLGLCEKLDFECCNSDIVMMAGLIPQRQVFLERIMN